MEKQCFTVAFFSKPKKHWFIYKGTFLSSKNVLDIITKHSSGANEYLLFAVNVLHNIFVKCLRCSVFIYLNTERRRYSRKFFSLLISNACLTVNENSIKLHENNFSAKKTCFFILHRIPICRFGRDMSNKKMYIVRWHTFSKLYACLL